MEIKIKSKKYGEKIVLIDDDDLDLIKDIRWGIAKSKYRDLDNDVYYVRGRVPNRFLSKYGNKRMIRMHRLIMNAKDDEQVDHKNHIGTDNRRENLRIATPEQNSANKRLQKSTSTGFKGVTFKKSKGLYIPRIRFNGKLIGGRQTKNIYDAAVQYNEMAVKYFGDFACINKLTEEQIALSKMKIPEKTIKKGNTTGYRGVCPTGNKFAATIFVNGRNEYLGCFLTAKEAAVAYNLAAIKYNKPPHFLNQLK